MIDSSIIRLMAAGMNTPVRAASPVSGKATAVRIHLPLGATSILTARPLRATSSKNRGEGSVISSMGARGLAWALTRTPSW
jgi:hypothetical protein